MFRNDTRFRRTRSRSAIALLEGGLRHGAVVAMRRTCRPPIALNTTIVTGL